MNPILFYGIFIVLLVMMLVLPYFSQRRKNQEYMNMLNSIKVGDLVKTAGGIIGKITKITDKGDFKTIILETGAKEKSYLELDMSMIYCILKSTKTNSKQEAEEQTEQTEETAKPEETTDAESKEAKLKPKTSKAKTAKTKK